jgi:hypothetical protein
MSIRPKNRQNTDYSARRSRRSARLKQIRRNLAGFRFDFLPLIHLKCPCPLGKRCCALPFCVQTELFMPAIPTTVESTPTTFTPAFPLVAQTNDFDDIFACCAMLAGKKIDEIREIAITKTRHPARGPYIIGEQQTAALLAQLGFVGTVYKEVDRVSDIPDVAFLMVDYVPEMDVGRHILFHRAKATHAPGTTIEYALDPAPWCKPADRVRTNFKNISGHWAIGIHAMNTKAGTSK